MNETLVKLSLLKKGVTDPFQETYSTGQICSVRLYNWHGLWAYNARIRSSMENFRNIVYTDSNSRSASLMRTRYVIVKISVWNIKGQTKALSLYT